MEISFREVHEFYEGQEFYKFKYQGVDEYKVLFVEGFKGDLYHTFVYETDYEILNDGIKWLSEGDKPEEAPKKLGFSGRIFLVTYLYESPTLNRMIKSVHPFIKRDGKYVSVLSSVTSEMFRLFAVRDDLVIDHDISRSLGKGIDYLANWFNIERRSGESDENLRSRIIEYLKSYVSSGTIDSIKAAITAFTGIDPDIIELWRDVSYFDYNEDDKDAGLPPDQWRIYLFGGGTPDNDKTFQAYFYDELFQLNVFFCILPFETIQKYSVDDLKDVIQAAKAVGIQGYLGWLVNEDFSETELSDWAVISP